MAFPQVDGKQWITHRRRNKFVTILQVLRFVFLYENKCLAQVIGHREGDEPLYEPMITLVIDVRCRAIIWTTITYHLRQRRGLCDHAVGFFRCTKRLWLNFMIGRTRWNCADILDHYLDLANFAGDDVSVRKKLKKTRWVDLMECFGMGRKWCQGQLTRSGCLHDVFFRMFEWSWLDSSTPKN